MLTNSCKPGWIVYEPFAGSGSTLIAAESLGSICYGVELSPNYCDVILTRWETATGKTATLLSRETGDVSGQEAAVA
jgi:DNA modification methylase